METCRRPADSRSCSRDKLHSTPPSSGRVPWLGQMHKWEKTLQQKIWHCPWNTKGSDREDHCRSLFLTIPLYIPWASSETQMILDRHYCCQKCSLEESEMHTYALLATHTRTKQTNWISFGFHLKPWISSTFFMSVQLTLTLLYLWGSLKSLKR